MSKIFWLSFCDTNRPKGQQFLGACVVDVNQSEADFAAVDVFLHSPLAPPGSEWLAAAIKKAHRLGCNPGGEVASYEIPAGHKNMTRYQRGVLMDRATIKRIDTEIERGQPCPMCYSNEAVTLEQALDKGRPDEWVCHECDYAWCPVGEIQP